MKFNFMKLRGRIRSEYKTQGDFAKAMGFSEATLSSRLNNSSEFTQGEIKKAANLLHLNNDEILSLFFTETV